MIGYSTMARETGPKTAPMRSVTRSISPTAASAPSAGSRYYNTRHQTKRRAFVLYALVYEGELRRQEGQSDDSDVAVLEELFYKFNMEHPRDFRGYNLSVSDIVKVGDRFYRWESLGWK
jgi:hypothetical protein